MEQLFRDLIAVWNRCTSRVDVEQAADGRSFHDAHNTFASILQLFVFGAGEERLAQIELRIKVHQ